jgi:hypothetical protein
MGPATLGVAGVDVDCGAAVLRARRDDAVVEIALHGGDVLQLAGLRPWRAFRWLHGQAHYPGAYWSAVMGGHVGYESRLELACLLLTDRDPGVRGLYSQPFQLAVMVGQRVRRHVPDYLVVRADGSWTVVDVKPARRLGDPVVLETFAWSRALVESRGWKFEIFTEPDPRLLANVRFLAGYRRSWQFDPDVLERIAAVGGGGCRIADLEQCVAGLAGGRDVCRSHLLHLVWSGRLRADLTEELTESTVVAV